MYLPPRPANPFEGLLFLTSILLYSVSPLSSDTPECSKEARKSGRTDRCCSFDGKANIRAHTRSLSRCALGVAEDSGAQVRFGDLNRGCDDILKLVTLITNKSDYVLLMGLAVL